MKKIKFFALIILACSVFASCGKKQEKQEDIVVISTDQEFVTDNDAVDVDDSNVSGNNWDSVIEEYKDLVDEYIAVVKKASNGDMSAISDMESVLNKAEALGNKLDEAEGSLTPEQWQKYLNIMSKMTDVATDISDFSMKALDNAAESYEDAMDAAESALDAAESALDNLDNLDDLDDFDF